MLDMFRKIIGVLLVGATCYIGYLDFITAYGNYKIYTVISVIVLSIIFYLGTFTDITFEKVIEEQEENENN